MTNELRPGFVLLSDFPAFSQPIIEAPASGTPVFLSRLEEHVVSFGEFRGLHFVPHQDVRATTQMVADTLGRHAQRIDEATHDVPRLRSVFDWDRLAAMKWRYMATAWSRRNLLGWRT